MAYNLDSFFLLIQIYFAPFRLLSYSWEAYLLHCLYLNQALK